MTVCVCYVGQVLNGISIEEYDSEFETNQNTLLVALADCMEGVTYVDIKNLQVTSPTPSTAGVEAGMWSWSWTAAPHSLRPVDLGPSAVAPFSVDVGAAVVVSYTVVANVPGATYTSLTSQLNESVVSGAFTEDLQTLAVTNGATYLETASSDSVVIEAVPVVDDDDSTGGGGGDGLSTGVIVGIAVGSAVGLALLGGGGYYYWTATKTSTDMKTNLLE